MVDAKVSYANLSWLAEALYIKPNQVINTERVVNTEAFGYGQQKNKSKSISVIHSSIPQL